MVTYLKYIEKNKDRVRTEELIEMLYVGTHRFIMQDLARLSAIQKYV